MKSPVNVAITGAAGQIGYALAFRVASGQMLGADQPVNLHLLEITPALGALQGVVMELNDCAFPTLNKIVATDDAKVAFKDCEVALLVGARPPGHPTDTGSKTDWSMRAVPTRRGCTAAYASATGSSSPSARPRATATAGFGCFSRSPPPTGAARSSSSPTICPVTPAGRSVNGCCVIRGSARCSSRSKRAG